jgi:hypothetical protein
LWCGGGGDIEIKMHMEIIASLVTRSGAIKGLMNVSDKTNE